MAGVVELVDRAVGLPPGPELSAALAGLPWEKVPNARLVEVVQARSRQLAHDQAELFAGLVEISHTVAVADLPRDPGEAVVRVGERFEWAAHEIAAGLTWTPTGAERELGFATALLERLPLVYTSLQRGFIDRGKAWVFAEYLDPAAGDVTEEQSRQLCARLVPHAPALTTRQLADRLYRALLAIDPDLRRRRYRRAVQERGVALYLDRHTGTATLVGSGLPAAEAAAAAERLDRLVEAVKRAGHPGRRAQISADLYLGMLNGSFHGLTEAEINDRLLATHRPEDHPEPHSDTGSDTGREQSAPLKRIEPPAPAERSEDTGGGVPANAGHAGLTQDTERVETVQIATGTVGTAADEDADRTGDQAETATSAGAGPWAADRVGVQEGVEIRVGLATAAGLDERPGEIPGLGPVGADVARAAVAAQLRGAGWKFAVVDSNGRLLLAGPVRSRPRVGSGPARVRGGVVELHLTVEELHRLPAESVMGDWHGVLAEIGARWAGREQLQRRLAANPRARFARCPLAEHVRIRDRTCCGPGCTRAARRSDLDHTWEHARGGETVHDNIGTGCKRHHPDKDRGWSLSQPEPGHFRWVSPLGRTYRTRGEPVRPDLPDLHPAPHAGEDTPAGQRPGHFGQRNLRYPATAPPRPPPSRPDPSPPPF